MIQLGYVLIAAGFLAGSYFSVIQADTVSWVPWAVALGAGALGIALARYGHHSSARSEDVLGSNITAIRSSLGSLAHKARQLHQEAAELNPYEVRHLIDERFMEDLSTFVEARESLKHRHGVQAYAEIMTSFATAERSLNRAWSASTDGYVDEVALSLEKAATHFRDAEERFLALG
jgi:hypothetical protein